MTTPTSGSNPPRYVTLDLIRKRSEHNEGLVATLEELALHQEELEAIGPVLGRTCGKTLKILLLQNNVIASMDPSDLRLMRSLEYLNLALNNITKIQGVDHCEFLTKLDLTLNFIDLDALEESIDSLEGIASLSELYLIGNPCSFNDLSESNGGNADADQTDAESHQSGWKGCRMYIVARLPQLNMLDGKEILRSERIVAMQRLPALIPELKDLAQSRRLKKAEEKGRLSSVDSPPDGEETTEHCPEVRARISSEMAKQRADKEEQELANQPKKRGEKEFEGEQQAAIERAKEREERGEIRQCNEGKWQFSFDEEKRPGYVLLDVPVQKFLSSSLIDVDIHPTYLNIVIKGKILRLILPAEVKAEEGTAQRSTTTGHLLIAMPKVDPEENMVSVRAASKFKEQENVRNARRAVDESKVVGKKGLACDMLEEATKKLTGSVRIDGIVKENEGEPKSYGIAMKAVSSKRKKKTEDGDCNNGDDGPPMMF